MADIYETGMVPKDFNLGIADTLPKPDLGMELTSLTEEYADHQTQNSPAELMTAMPQGLSNTFGDTFSAAATNVRQRIERTTQAVRRSVIKAGAIALAGVSVAGGLAAQPSSAEAAAKHRVKPSQINGILQHYLENDVSENLLTLTLRDVQVTRSSFSMRGVCIPSNTRESYVRTEVWNRKGERAVSCNGVGGEKYRFNIPMGKISLADGATRFNFTQPLNLAGNRAANSAGIKAKQHGNTRRIDVTFAPNKKEAEAKIFYYAAKTKGKHGKQVKEIDITTHSGHLTDKVDYRPK